MIYVYKCPVHGKFEIEKPMSEATKPEFCHCGNQAQRVYMPLAVTWGFGGWEYDNEGLGDNMILRHRG